MIAQVEYARRVPINYALHDPQVALLRRQEDIHPLGQDKIIAHLTSQDVAIVKPPAGRKGLEDILNDNPQLKIISTAPNLAGRLANTQGFQRLLIEHNVAYGVGRLARREFDANAVMNVPKNDRTPTFLEKYAYYLAAHCHPQMVEDMEFMRTHNDFKGIRIADQYFGSQQGVSVEAIAANMGFEYSLARREFAGLLSWMGMDYQDKVTIGVKKLLVKRINAAK